MFAQDMFQYVLIRCIAFLALALLVLTAPWYVSLFVLCVWAIASQWHELIALAAVLDVWGGFGIAANIVPIATGAVLGSVLLHSVLAPVLLPRGRVSMIE